MRCATILMGLVAGWLCCGGEARAGEALPGTLALSASVVVSCKLGASVPRRGTANRTAGTASFSLECSKAGIVESAVVHSVAREAATSSSMVQEMRLSTRRVDYDIAAQVRLHGGQWSAATEDGIAVAHGSNLKISTIYF